MAVIFESPLHTDVRQLVEAYEARDCEDSRLTSDIDKCYAVMEAIDIDRRLNDTTEPFFHEVSQQLRESKKLCTPFGEALLDRLCDPTQRDPIMAQFDLANIQLRDSFTQQTHAR